MKTELNTISAIKKILRIEVPRETVDQARDLAVKELQKKAKVRGFREGKVPTPVIQQKFGAEVERETFEHVVDLTLFAAFKEADVRPVSRPEIEPGLHSAAGDMTYTATFEVLPEIPLKPYKGMKLSRENPEVGPDEVRQEMDRLQHAMTQLEPMAGDVPLAEGHVAKIDFQGTVGGKAFDGSQAKDFTIEIGTGSMLADFEKGLLGAKAGETRHVKFFYPKDYFNKELAGKEAEFSVQVRDIRKKNVPKLDDEFAKDVGDYKNIGEVEKHLKERILQHKENQQKNNLYNQIVAELIAKNKFEVPPSLIQAELRHMLERFAEEMKRRGQSLEKIGKEEQEKLINDFLPEATRRVQGFLLLSEVAKSAQIAVSDDEVRTRIEGMAKAYGKPAKELHDHYEKNQLLGSLHTQLLHEKALEFVLKEAKIKTVKPKIDKKKAEKGV